MQHWICVQYILVWIVMHNKRDNIVTIVNNSAWFSPDSMPPEMLEVWVDLAKQADNKRRNAHVTRLDDYPLVRLATLELGKEEVMNITYEHRGYFIQGETKEYLNQLRSKLGALFLADTSKTHLREYVDQKFGADLGL